jgi:hypothetical protein
MFIFITVVSELVLIVYVFFLSSKNMCKTASTVLCKWRHHHQRSGTAATHSGKAASAQPQRAAVPPTRGGCKAATLQSARRWVAATARGRGQIRIWPLHTARSGRCAPPDPTGQRAARSGSSSGCRWHLCCRGVRRRAAVETAAHRGVWRRLRLVGGDCILIFFFLKKKGQNIRWIG